MIFTLGEWSRQKTHEIKYRLEFFLEIAFLAVLNFFPVQKLKFGKIVVVISRLKRTYKVKDFGCGCLGRFNS